MLAPGRPGRRPLLVGAVLAVAGCSARAGSSPGSTGSTGSSAPASASGSAWASGLSPSAPASPSWGALAARLSGRLYRPGEAGYDIYRLAANPRFDAVRPAGVARCASAADVAAALRWAREAGVRFSVRSGGHNYGGWSTGPDLVIDLSGLSSVRVAADRSSAVVGAGTRLVDVYRQLAAAGVGIPAGSCPSVAMAGLALGGGVGVLTRSWGLTCDTVTGVDLVAADGTTRRGAADADADLLWAARGGGGGSFGVVTSFTVRTRPAPDVTVFYLRWPWRAAAAVIDAWQHWAPTGDRRLWSTCKALTTPTTPRVLVAGTWTGPATGLDAVLAPMLAGAGVAPVTRTAGRHGYLDAMLLEAGCRTDASCHLPPAGTLAREREAATSHLPAAVMPSAAVADLVGLVAGMARTPGLTEAGVSLDALGGAVTDLDAGATAFVHRASPFSVQYTATWSDAGAGPDRFDALVRGARDRMTAHLGPGAYVNYQDAAVPDWARAYWGSNLERLRSVKRAVDPDGAFTFAQSVPA